MAIGVSVTDGSVAMGVVTITTVGEVEEVLVTGCEDAKVAGATVCELTGAFELPTIGGDPERFDTIFRRSADQARAGAKRAITERYNSIVEVLAGGDECKSSDTHR